MATDAGPRPEGLVLGGDLGGTATRMLVADATGAILGRGIAGGGNPISHPDTAVAAFSQALGAALVDVDPARVHGAVIGVAGGIGFGWPQVREPFDRACSDARLSPAVRYVSDLEVAFAAGTAEPDGTVLIAGTGAVAGAVTRRGLGRTSDGHGWLLGDDGSGFWLGREAARATLRTLDEAQPPGPLATSVLRELGVPDPPSKSPAGDQRRTDVIRKLYDRPPVRLAELAPLVTAAQAAGDPVAEHIVEQAAVLLTATVARLRRVEERTPIVLAGSLTRADSSLGARLRTMVSAQLAGDLLSAHDGAAGAAWLALVATEPTAATHDTRRRLIGGPPERRPDVCGGGSAPRRG